MADEQATGVVRAATALALALAVAGCTPAASTAPTSATAALPTPSPTSAAAASPSPSHSPADGPFLGDVQLADGRHSTSPAPDRVRRPSSSTPGSARGPVAGARHFRPIGAFTHVCAYARAGIGGSSGVDGTKTTGDIVDDLRELVAAAGIPRPYVLVGHSIAGLHLRVMGGEHRDELAGMLFVDPSVPHQPEAWQAALPPASSNEPDWLTDLRSSSLVSGWPPPDTGEFYDIAADIPRVDAVTSFGDLPVIVLTAGIQSITPAGEPLGDVLHEVWYALHEELAAMSSNGRHDLVPGARHGIQDDRPAVVVDAIRELVDRARG